MREQRKEDPPLVRPERVSSDFAKVPVARLAPARQHGELDVGRQQRQVADLRDARAADTQSSRGVGETVEFAAVD